jgi:hypothetical protein
MIHGCTFYCVSDYGSSLVGPADASFLSDTAAVPSDTTNGMYCCTVIRMLSVVSDLGGWMRILHRFSEADGCRLQVK